MESSFLEIITSGLQAECAALIVMESTTQVHTEMDTALMDYNDYMLMPLTQ